MVWKIGKVDGQRPQYIRLVLKPQPLRESHRFAKPKVIHELPVFEFHDLGIGEELNESQRTETSMRDQCYTLKGSKSGY